MVWNFLTRFAHVVFVVCLTQSFNLRAGTEIPAVLTKDLDSRMIQEGQEFVLRLSQAIGIGSAEVLPRGAEIVGKVAVWQDQDGNLSTLVLKFEQIRIGVAARPVELKVKAVEPGGPLEPSLQRSNSDIPEMERRSPGDPRNPLPPGQTYPEDKDPRTGERRRGPQVGTSGGISMRKLPASDDVGPPSAIGLRRENVAKMKIAQGEDGAAQITIDNADIAIREGARFRLELTKDLSLRR